MEEQQLHKQDDEPSVNGRHDGHRLRHILQKLGLSVYDFAEKPFLDKSRPAAYVLLRKATFSREELALMCYLFNLEVTDFDYPLDYLRTPFNEGRLLERHNSVAAFHALAAHIQQEETKQNSFLHDYFEDLARFACQATKHLRVYHYLSKAAHQIKPFALRQYELYYEKVEATMAQQTSLRYERFAALPIQMSEASPTMIDYPEIKVLELLPKETISHVVRCLKRFGERFSYYAVAVPTRLNSFTLVDDKYVISEYDRLNRHRKASNDLMFVDRVISTVGSDPMAGLWQVYSNDLDNLVREPDSSARRKISMERILEVIVEQLGSIEHAIKKREQELHQVNNSLQLEIFGSKSLDSLSKAVELKNELEQLECSKNDWTQKLETIKPILIQN
ncbi:MAG: hypothetical protein KF734_18910 [Saprospiraceae bacterium]|nr:hypothetical protein [Saprospiraceae bacterium]